MPDDPDDRPADGGDQPTLAELRLRIQALAAGTDPTDGGFVVACARTGVSPVPIDGYRFDCRATAAEAATYARQYRARLHDLDRETMRYDPIVHEVGVGQRWAPSADRAWPEWLPAPGDDRWSDDAAAQDADDPDAADCEAAEPDADAPAPSRERAESGLPAGGSGDRVQGRDDPWFQGD